MAATDKEKKSVRPGTALAVLALVSALAVWGLDRGGVMEPLQLKAYDLLFRVRAAVGAEPVRTASPVAIVGIDDSTFADEAFRIPETLWHKQFSTVITGLAQAEAKVVGLDFLLPQALFDDLVPDYSRTWLKTLVYARSLGTPVVSGLVQSGERQLMPQARYLQIIGPEYTGLFNLTSDIDDFIRRQRLFFPSGQDPQKGMYSVTFLLAKAYRPDLQLPAETVFIDYDSAEPPFPRYSFADVHRAASAGDADKLRGMFQGRIVLIGETDALTQDRHATPLYHLTGTALKRTPGVEILGHTVNTVLAGRFFRETGAAARLALYLLLTLAVSAATIYWPPRRLFFVTPALLAVCGGGSVLAFNRYLIPPLVGSTVALLLGQGVSFAYRHWVLDKEKRLVRNAFAKYLSPDVVARIVEDPSRLALGGERREMTVFFSDLAGFTGISERLAPEELVVLLNRYLSLVTGIILSHGGTVDKFEGDAVMAFWGAPLPEEGHAVRACLAALDQQAAMKDFNEELARDGLPGLTVRMGINTGPMIVGNMGSAERFDYTVMGDAVNLGSRLEGANKAFGTGIMISRETFERAAGAVAVRELDMLRVKGKDMPVRVYELLGRAGDLDGAREKQMGIFEEGLASYRAADFQKALEIFETVLAACPDDGPSRTYAERCRRYLDAPPPAGWDGVFTLTAK